MFEPRIQTAADGLINYVFCVVPYSCASEFVKGGNMKAVIKTGGKQYYVEEGQEIFVEKLEGNEGDKVTFNEVLMLGDKIGNPTVSGAKVTGTIVKHGKGKKIRIFTYKPNTTSTRKKQGHRQPYTKVKIEKIG